MSFIYLDNNATTLLAEPVLQAMLPYLREQYGNASSIQHSLGRQAHRAVEHARQQVAHHLKVKEKEIIFTSGATEGLNQILRGVAQQYQGLGRHIITSTTEHSAVLATCAALEKIGFEISYLPVDKQGVLDLHLLEQAIRPDTIMVCLMAANNETGLLHPVGKIADICAAKEVLYCCDATQAIGKINLDLSVLPIDLLVFSAHKFHGPKGVGGLFIRRKSKPIQIPALLSGGSQEGGLRSGTLNVPAIVGCGAAIACATPDSQTLKLRDTFEERFVELVPESRILAQQSPRLPNTSSIHIKHVKASDLIPLIGEVALSAGSACAAGLRDPSHVLLAMGLSPQEAFCTIRVSLSKYTTAAEIDRALHSISQAVAHLRQQSPLWMLYKQGLLDD